LGARVLATLRLGSAGAAALADQPAALAMLMTFGAGGILYLVFNDVAPQVPLKNYFLPPMGALLGFVIGMIGYKLTGG
jgi:ZIP family zinc transporter